MVKKGLSRSGAKLRGRGFVSQAVDYAELRVEVARRRFAGVAQRRRVYGSIQRRRGRGAVTVTTGSGVARLLGG